VTYEKEEAPATTTKVEKPSNLPVLKKGSEGNSVKALQILLIGYGYSCGRYGADGDFGDDTEKAVRAFQADRGLEVDGVVGPDTWAELLGV
jgi:peptidoglycan hydrolase-like protein with peptidoglycan-binding domain